MRASADLHVGDLDFGDILALPSFAAIPGAAREVEDANLLPLAMPHHLGGDLGAFDRRLPSLDVLPIGGQEDAVERDLAPRFGREQRHLDGDPFFGPELLAAGRENGVGHGRGTLIGSRTWVNRGPATLLRLPNDDRS